MGANISSRNTEASGSGQKPPSTQWKPSPRQLGQLLYTVLGGRAKPEVTLDQARAPPCLQPPLPTC